MFGYQNWQGLLGGYQQPYAGLLGQNTQNMMQQYLQSLFMRRYAPPAVSGSGVTSQMGHGGMQYRAPTVANVAMPQQQQNQGLLSAYQPGVVVGYM